MLKEFKEFALKGNVLDLAIVRSYGCDSIKLLHH